MSIAATALTRLNRAEKDWARNPDGQRYAILLQCLHELILASLADSNGRLGHLRTSKGRLFWAMPVDVRLDCAGTGTIVMGQHSVPLEDVVHEFLLALGERYLRNPAFRITAAGFIRCGVAWKAYSMARSARRQLGELRESVNLVERAGAADPPDEKESGLLAERQAIWFHERASEDSHPVWRNQPPLSLRHCYAAVRHQSGATLIEIAREIGVHSSRLTALKKELRAFFPALEHGGWIPLGEFAGSHLTATALGQAGIADHAYRDLARGSASPDLQRWIRSHKHALWAVYLFARDLITQSHPACGRREERIVAGPERREVVLSVDVIELPTEGTALLVRGIDLLP